MRTILVVLVAAVLLASTVTVKAQEQATAIPACLSPQEVKEMVASVNWKYFPLGKWLEKALCVEREGNILRVTWPEGTKITGLILGGFGFQIDGSGVTKWDLRGWKPDPGVSETNVSWVRAKLGPDEWLVVMRFEPRFKVGVRRGGVVAGEETEIGFCYCRRDDRVTPTTTIYLLPKPNREMTYQWYIPPELGRERTLSLMNRFHDALLVFSEFYFKAPIATKP